MARSTPAQKPRGEQSRMWRGGLAVIGRQILGTIRVRRSPEALPPIDGRARLDGLDRHPPTSRHLLLDVGAEEKLVGFAGGHWLAIEEALHELAAELLELDRVAFRFSAFSDDIHAEIMGKRDDRSEDD